MNDVQTTNQVDTKQELVRMPFEHRSSEAVNASGELNSAAPVLRFVGRSLTGLPLEPPKRVTNGNEKIELPSSIEQKIGFVLDTVEKTVTVARLFPSLYKLFIKKGKNK